MDFVRYDKMDIQSGDKIFLCSDGFSDIIKKLSSKELYNITIDQMVEISTETDDKTVIVIEEKRW